MLRARATDCTRQRYRMASSIEKSRHTPRLDPAALLIGCAALAFFSGLALLCAAGAVAGLVGLMGRVPDTSRGILEIVDTVTPSGTARTLRGPVENLIEHRALALGVLGAGMVGSIGAGVAYLWSFRLSFDALSPTGRPTVRRLSRGRRCCRRCSAPCASPRRSRPPCS